MQNIFVNYREVHQSSILVANNTGLDILEVGDVKIDVKGLCDERRTLRIRNVYFAPDLCTNLLSVSKIYENGGQVEFEEKYCLVNDERGYTLAKCYMRGGLYELDLVKGKTYTENAVCMAGTSRLLN